jgi:hypothetical protein
MKIFNCLVLGTLLTAAFGASALAAYAGYEDDVGVPNRSPAVLAEKTVPGTYSVPVPAALEPYSSYPVAKVCWYAEGEKIGLGYLLPIELTGFDNSDIRLSGAAPAGQTRFTLTGDHGVAVCTRADGQVSCRVEYERLPIDATRVDLELSRQFRDPFELGARRDVSTLFQHEPVGIISFPDLPSPFPATDAR